MNRSAANARDEAPLDRPPICMGRSAPAYLYDAFAATPFEGNPAGVVLTNEQCAASLLRMARELGAPTTAFVSALDDARPQIRYFTPKMEIGACGHATLAALDAFARSEGDAAMTQRLVRFHTPAGASAGMIDDAEADSSTVWVQAAPAALGEEIADSARICEGLGVSPDAIDRSMPISMARTGLRHLLVPVRRSEVVDVMRPSEHAILQLARDTGAETIAVFDCEGLDERRYRCRDFCAGIGHFEESASGTTNCAIVTSIARARPDLLASGASSIEFRCAQGNDRRGDIRIRLERPGTSDAAFWIGGRVIRTLTGALRLPPRDIG